jgi:magnesium transporter
MAFLSELLGKPVTDLDGVWVGVLGDVIANARPEIAHPVVVAVVVKGRGSEIIIPYTDIAVLLAPAIPLNCRQNNLHTYLPAEQDVRLAEEVMDKQIIDTDDVRVVRVNDVELVRVNGSVVASNVDVGTLGLLRRLGLAKLAQRTASRLHRTIKPSLVSWDDVEMVSSRGVMRLRVTSEGMSDLHPADLAAIISDMDRAQGSEFLESMNIEQLADTLEEVEEDFQVSLVEDMPDEKVADVLEEMSPDEAADLLAELPKERSDRLITLMEEEDAQDVRKLLSFPEESAGGLMTTEYIAVEQYLTAAQVIQTLRETASEAETFFYIYVVNPEGKLTGVFSLGDLVLADPNTRVEEFMHTRIVSVNLTDDQEHVAQIVARYNLLAVPVVDDLEVLHGIVTADDALDKIIPTVWKKRLPRYYR